MTKTKCAFLTAVYTRIVPATDTYETRVQGTGATGTITIGYNAKRSHYENHRAALRALLLMGDPHYTNTNEVCHGARDLDSHLSMVWIRDTEADNDTARSLERQTNDV